MSGIEKVYSNSMEYTAEAPCVTLTMPWRQEQGSSRIRRYRQGYRLFAVWPELFTVVGVYFAAARVCVGGPRGGVNLADSCLSRPLLAWPNR